MPKTQQKRLEYFQLTSTTANQVYVFLGGVFKIPSDAFEQKVSYQEQQLLVGATGSLS